MGLSCLKAVMHDGGLDPAAATDTPVPIFRISLKGTLNSADVNGSSKKDRAVPQRLPLVCRVHTVAAMGIWGHQGASVVLGSLLVLMLAL